MKRNTTPFVILALTAALGIFFQSDFIRFLIGFEVLLYVIGIAEVWYLSRSVAGALMLSQNIVRQGEGFVLPVTVKNGSHLPLPEVLVRVAIRMIPDCEEVLLTGKLMMDGKETGTLHFSMEARHAGAMEVRLERIAVSDHLGLFLRKCEQISSICRKVYVFPKGSEETETLLTGGNAGEGEDGSAQMKNADGREVLDLRAYRAGDLLKMVHWKLSARMNELMIKEMGEAGESFVRLYVNLYEKEEKRRDRDKWDAFFAAADDLTMRLVRQNQSFAAVWIDGKRQSIEEYVVRGRQGRREMMCALLASESFSDAAQMELMKELPVYEADGEWIEITIQGNIAYREGGSR